MQRKVFPDIRSKSCESVTAYSYIKASYFSYGR